MNVQVKKDFSQKPSFFKGQDWRVRGRIGGLGIGLEG